LTIFYYIKVLLSLTIVFSLLYMLFRFTQWAKLTKYEGELKIIERVAVDQKSTICVVHYRECAYLLGVGGGKVTLIDRILTHHDVIHP